MEKGMELMSFKVLSNPKVFGTTVHVWDDDCGSTGSVPDPEHCHGVPCVKSLWHTPQDGCQRGEHTDKPAAESGTLCTPCWLTLPSGHDLGHEATLSEPFWIFKNNSASGQGTRIKSCRKTDTHLVCLFRNSYFLLFLHHLTPQNLLLHSSSLSQLGQIRASQL